MDPEGDRLRARRGLGLLALLGLPGFLRLGLDLLGGGFAHARALHARSSGTAVARRPEPDAVQRTWSFSRSASETTPPTVTASSSATGRTALTRVAPESASNAACASAAVAPEGRTRWRS